jgi:hypothetical protein
MRAMAFRSWRTLATDYEVTVVAACLRAAADGPFFPDWEFTTIFGFTRDEIRAFADSWPTSSDEPVESRAINASLNNLLGYPHGLDAGWSNWIPAARDDVEALFTKIREASGANDASRARLASELAQLEALSDADLQTRARRVAEVVAAAGRLGVEIPARFAR